MAYVDAKIIPTKYLRDAQHVAIAVVRETDVVVSWNLEHIVKVKTRREVNAINQLRGYHAIELATPEEVLGYGRTRA